MTRREFITLLGGAAAAWPLAARAQQPDRVRRIGVLMSNAEGSAEGQARVAALVKGLEQLGWSDGRNVRIDYRWTGDAERLRRNVAELISLSPDVILVSGRTAAVAAVQQATRTVPIVFTIILDPVGAGLVESLARPSGNATGFTVSEYGFGAKWLELLKEIAPGVKQVAVIREAGTTVGGGQLAAIQAVAPALGMELIPIGERDDQIPMICRLRTPRDDQGAIGGACEYRDAALDLASVTHADRDQLHSKRRRHGLNCC